MGVALQRLLSRLKSSRTVSARCSRNVITNSLSTASSRRADNLLWRTDASIRARTSDYVSNLWRCNKNGSRSFVTLQFARFSHCHSTLAADEYHEDHDREEQRPLSAAEEGTSFIGVKAYLLGTSIDLKRLQAEYLRFGSTHKVVPTNSRTSNYVIIRSSDGLAHLPPTRNSGSVFKYESWEENRYRYIVVFQYGSVVLFNFSHNDEEEKQWLQFCRKYASGFLTEIKDDYGILEKPSLDKWMQDGPDYIVLKKFDIDCIRIIGSVLGQSIALDHFVRQVDEVVAEFIELNRGIEKTGTFTMQQQKLFQLVSKANSNLADVILKLGLLERSDIAWKNAKYAQIWEYLRDEYELTQRFGSLDYKLKFVEQNVRFFLEILQNVKSNTLSEKSNSLEWVIICIISVEGLIGICDIILRVVFDL